MWEYRTQAPVFSSPSICLSADTGHLQDVMVPTSDGDTKDVMVPASRDVIVLVGSHDHRLYCLEAATGALVWSVELDSELYATTTTLQRPSHSKTDCL